MARVQRINLRSFKSLLQPPNKHERFRRKEEINNFQMAQCYLTNTRQCEDFPLTGTVPRQCGTEEHVFQSASP
jgi:hypothetical protein